MKFLILFIFLSLKPIWTLDKNKDCKCSDINARIINGTRASIFDYPWQIQIAKLTTKWSFFDYIRRKLKDHDQILLLHTCGGSIVNERFILTAAHCVIEENIDNIKDYGIGYGYDDKIKIFTEDRFIKIENVFIHPEYNSTTKVNDIALIKLVEPIEFYKSSEFNVQPACLPENSDYVDQYEGVLKLSGFGLIGRPKLNIRTSQFDNLNFSRYLQETDVYDVTNSYWQCEGKEKEMICAGNSRNETACLGDSGGPLHEIKNGKARVIGVTSFVLLKFYGNALVGCLHNTAFARLTAYMDFIREYVGDNYCY